MSGRPQTQHPEKAKQWVPWAPSTQHSLRSWALRHFRNILFYFPLSAGVETLCKGETEQLTRNIKEKALTGAGFLLRWTSQYIFCRCLGAACKRQRAQGQRGNRGCGVVFQLHLPVLSSPAAKGGRHEEPASPSEDPLSLDRPCRSNLGQN